MLERRVDQGAGEAAAVAATTAGLSVVPIVRGPRGPRGPRGLRFGAALPDLRIMNVTAAAPAATEGGRPMLLLGQSNGRVSVLDPALLSRVGESAAAGPGQASAVSAHCVASGPVAGTVVIAAAGGVLHLTDTQDGTVRATSPGHPPIEWMTTVRARGKPWLAVSADRGYVLLNENMARTGGSGLAHYRCASVLCDEQGDLLLLGGPNEAVDVFDPETGSVLGWGQRSYVASAYVAAMRYWRSRPPGSVPAHWCSPGAWTGEC